MPTISEVMGPSSRKPQGADGINPNGMRELLRVIIPKGEHAPRLREAHQFGSGISEERPAPRITKHHTRTY